MRVVAQVSLARLLPACHGKMTTVSIKKKSAAEILVIRYFISHGNTLSRSISSHEHVHDNNILLVIITYMTINFSNRNIGGQL